MSTPSGGGDQSPPNVSLWAKILSAVFGGITLVFFMVLVFFSLFGFEIPESSCYLVAIVFGIFGGLAFGFISGTAMANGTIPVPGTTTQLSVSLGGGVASTIVLALIGYWISCGHSPPVIVDIDSVHTFPDKDGKSAVQVKYHLKGSEPTNSAYIEASWKNDFAQPTRHRLDNPDAGDVTFELDVDGVEPGTKFWVRIRVEARDGHEIAKSKSREEKTPAKK